mgnify:CR=1 FL=1
MKKTLFTLILMMFVHASNLFANEVNIFSARHYDSDVQLYEKFTAKTGIKVNVISGKSGALEKRIMEEGSDSKADLYITADAGIMISKLIKYSIEHDLVGIEKWVGLPGTVGGAVRGNAGCNGLETLEIFEKALLLNPKTGEIREEKPDYFDFSYRHSKVKETNEIVLNATFKLKYKDISDEEQKEIMDGIRKFRLTKQPFGKTTGSFFKKGVFF